MNIIVHNHFTLRSDSDTFNQYHTPIWEIEIQSPILDSTEFEASLRCNDNFTVSEGHANSLRSVFSSTGIVSDFLTDSQQDFILNLVSQSSDFAPRFYKPIDQYKSTVGWLASVIKDQPGFEMVPHLDNSHVMVQMVVNLLQDNATSTEFYKFSESVPCYRAPLKKNHGVIFLNTPGAMHGITNINQTRWIFYGGLIM